MRLLVLAHANRTAGGRSVGRNMLMALERRESRVEILPVLPAGYGYEELVERTAMRPLWFRQNGSLARRLFFDAVVLPRYAREVRADAILALGNVGLSRPPVPQAVLIHDAHYVYPTRCYGRMPGLERARYLVQGFQIARSIPRCSLVYCQTRTMLRRIQETYSRVHSVKLLANCLPDTLQQTRAQSVLPERLGPYGNRFRLICLTRYYAHKNIEILIETFRKHRKCLRDVVVFLTIPCEQAKPLRRLNRAIDRWGLGEQIVNLGAIEQSDVARYFGYCHALMLPTLLESFSTTYLEAMHCGLPILTSDLDFARDVCGEAALYFDPWSPKSIAEAVVRLRVDSELRSRLAEAGRLRLAGVHNQSWDDIAEILISDLRSVACRTC